MMLSNPLPVGTPDLTAQSPASIQQTTQPPTLATVRPRQHAPLPMAAGVPFKIRDIGVGSAPWMIAVSGTGNIYVTNNSSGSVSVINPAGAVSAWTVAATIAVGTAPRGICYAPTTNRIYVACNDAKIYVIDPDSNTVVGTITISSQSAPSQLIFVPSQNCLYVGFITISGLGVQKVSGLTSTGASTVSAVVATSNSSPGFLVYVPSVDRVYSINGNGPSINAINPSTNAITASVSSGGASLTAGVSGACYCPLNDRIYVACVGTAPGTGSQIAVVNPNTNTVIAAIACAADQPHGCVFHPETGLIYVTVSGATPRLLIVNPTNNTVYTCAESGVIASAGPQPAYIPHVGLIAVPGASNTSIYS